MSNPSPSAVSPQALAEQIERWRLEQWTNPQLAYRIMGDLLEALAAQAAAKDAEIEKLKGEGREHEEINIRVRHQLIEAAQRERDRAQAIIHAASRGVRLSWGMLLKDGGSPDIDAIRVECEQRAHVPAHGEHHE